MADSAVVGILRALLTADTAQFDAGMRKAVSTTKATEKAIDGLGKEVAKLTPQAERMVKSLGGDKLLYSANNLTAAVGKLGGAQKLTDAEMKRVNGTLTTAIAKYTALGQQAPKAMVDLEKATRSTAGGTDFLQAKVVALGAAAGTMAAQFAGQAIRSLIRFGREAIDSAGHLVDLSNQTGLSTTTLQRMDAVAGQTGTTLDVLSNAAFKLGTRISGGGDSVRAAVQALGLDFEKLRNQRLDQQFEATLVAMGRMQDATKRNDAAVELFGQRLAKTALGAAKDYEAIAAAAVTASDVQLQALDVIGDRLDKFSKDAKATTQSMLADALFAIDEIRKHSLKETLFLGAGSLTPQNAARLFADLGKARALADAKRKESTQTAQEQTQAEIDYVKSLEAARKELGKLDAAERKQLDAAKQMGVGTEQLEDMLVKFGISSGNAEAALVLYNAAMREGEKASKDFAKSQKELAKETEEANRRWLDILGAIDAAEIRRKRSRLEIIGDLNAPPDLEAAFAKLEQPRSSLEIINNLQPNLASEPTLQDMVEQLEELERIRAHQERFLNTFKAGIANIGNAATSNLFSLFFAPSNESARQAKEEYEAIRKSGTASAEEITRAFQRMKEAQDGFLERFRGWTSGILREFGRMIDEMLGMFVRELLGGMMRALARSKLGQAVIGWVTDLIPGLSSTLLKTGVSTAASVGTATATGTSVMAGSESLAASFNASAAGTTATGTGGGFIGGLSAAAPFAIAFAAPLGAAWLGGAFKKYDGELLREARSLTRMGVPVSQWPEEVRNSTLVKRALQPGHSVFDPVDFNVFGRQFRLGEGPRSFANGGFVPPNVTMPAILHGGSRGEMVVPLAQMGTGRSSIGGGARSVHFHVSTIDARGIREFVASKDFTDAAARVFEDNKGFLTSRLNRALRP